MDRGIGSGTCVGGPRQSAVGDISCQADVLVAGDVAAAGAAGLTTTSDQAVAPLVVAMAADAVGAGAATGELRNDVAPDELAAYCLHALAAAVLPSAEAVRRLAEVTLAGLRPAPGG